MMQINSTLPSHNLNSFHHKGVGFQCRASSALNPAPHNHIDKTKLHLSNLDKILITKPPGPELDPSRAQQPVKPADAIRGGILQGLNLPWAPPPEKEIVSPNCLQRLLPMAEAEHSPRNHIAARWREYHGTHNWAGLLDPLDENLRREVVRYGEFVQAAYNSFHSGPASVHRTISMPDRAYRVTKSLYATSSVGLPKWLDDVAPDLGWMTQRSSCIGYVAVCQDEKEIARMGRRDVVIALRGTSTCLEWAENFRNALVQLPDSSSQPDQDNNNNNTKAKVECGFLKLFKTHGERVPSLAESVVQEVKRLMQQYKGEELSISVTGHSLGAALALLVADEVSHVASSPIAVFSFGGPRVGNRAFAKRLETRGVKVLRVVNKQDVVTKMPGLLVNHEEVEKKLRASGVARGVMNVVADEWVYSHVGAELTVETRMSPYLRPDADVACCHDLEAYLHLVDGYLASDGPFRANAKRSLVKLLTEQGSNVKRLYTSKAKSLTRLNVQREAHASSN